MCAAVGLNTRLPNAGLTRMLVSGARGFHAGTYERPGSPNHLARPLAVAPTQTRTFGGPLIHPGGCMYSLCAGSSANKQRTSRAP